MKERCTNKVLCEDLPPEFFEYMTYVTRLEFEQAADFDYLKQLVLSAAKANKIDLFDNIFDWSIKLT